MLKIGVAIRSLPRNSSRSESAAVPSEACETAQGWPVRMPNVDVIIAMRRSLAHLACARLHRTVSQPQKDP